MGCKYYCRTVWGRIIEIAFAHSFHHFWHDFIVRILHLVQPFMAILPEIASPDRKVIIETNWMVCGESTALVKEERQSLTWRQDDAGRGGLLDIKFEGAFGLTRLNARFPSTKRWCGQQLHCSFSWSCHKSLFTVSCPLTLQILFSGWELFLLLTVVHLWNWVSPPSSPQAWSCNFCLAPTSLKLTTA